MTEAPSWHDEARRLIEGGVSVRMAALAIGRGQTTIRVALDINGARTRHEENRKALRDKARAKLVGVRKRGEASRTGVDHDEQRSVIRAYADAPAKRPLTLPQISIQSLPDDGSRVIRFAPRTKAKPISSGVERIRQIHRAMIRAGKLPEPGLPEQLHQ